MLEDLMLMQLFVNNLYFKGCVRIVTYIGLYELNCLATFKYIYIVN